MNVLVGVYMILVLIVAAAFAIGVLLFGIAAIGAVYGCITENPEERFVIGIDYGKHYNDVLDRIVDATERCVDVTVKATEAMLPDDEEYEEAEDFSNIER